MFHVKQNIMNRFKRLELEDHNEKQLRNKGGISRQEFEFIMNNLSKTDGFYVNKDLPFKDFDKFMEENKNDR